MTDAIPLPPHELRFMGEGDADFLRTGDRMVEDLRRHAGLRSRSVVLDVGSGYGRLAHALQRQDFAGGYVGRDILPRHVAWCQRELASDRYSFGLIDVHNDRYNPTGARPPEEVEYDVDVAAFDVVCYFSVFTHMWPGGIERYLQLTRRALRRGGRAYATAFLLNDSWRELHAADAPAPYRVPHEAGPHCRVMDLENPLHVIAVDQEWLLRAARRSGLVPVEVRLGPWCGREAPGWVTGAAAFDGTSMQDAIVLRRRSWAHSALAVARARLTRGLST